MGVENVMMAERNKDDVTILALSMNGMRFVAQGVTAENADAFKKTIGRIMMAVNIHIEETDEDIAHNTKRAEIYLAGVELGATLAAPTLKVKQYAISTAKKQMLERQNQGKEN